MNAVDHNPSATPSLRRIVAVFCFALALAAAALASGSELGKDDFGNFSGARPKAPVVQIAAVPLVVIAPGQSSTVALDFRVPDNFHINSNQPRNDSLIPTTVSFDPPTDIAIGKLSYPAGRDVSFSFATDKLNVYTGDFRVTALVRAARSMPAGTFRIHGTLKYQACDRQQCFPPTNLPLQLDVRVRKNSPRRASHNTGQSPHIH